MSNIGHNGAVSSPTQPPPLLFPFPSLPLIYVPCLSLFSSSSIFAPTLPSNIFSPSYHPSFPLPFLIYSLLPVSFSSFIIPLIHSPFIHLLPSLQSISIFLFPPSTFHLRFPSPSLPSPFPFILFLSSLTILSIHMTSSRLRSFLSLSFSLSTLPFYPFSHPSLPPFHPYLTIFIFSFPLFLPSLFSFPFLFSSLYLSLPFLPFCPLSILPVSCSSSSSSLTSVRPLSPGKIR